MIKLESLTKQFDKKIVLNSINYEFQEDKFYGIVGESGCGKTTLLRIISLLDEKYSGKLFVDNVDRNSLKRKEREKRRVQNFSYVFSESRLLPYLSVKENVLLPLTIQKRVYSEKRLGLLADQRKVLNLLERSDVTSLSEGEKQRISILRALILDSPILICDEPTAHLNESLGDEITSLLASICKSEKKLVIMATHD